MEKLESMVNDHGFTEQTFVSHRYDNGEEVIEVMFRPELEGSPEFYRVKCGSSLMTFEDEVGARGYVLACLDANEDYADDGTKFGMVMHDRGYDHDFVLGVDYFKEIPGYTVHLRKEMHATKDAETTVTLYLPKAGGNYDVQERTFPDEKQSDTYLERTMEEYK